MPRGRPRKYPLPGDTPMATPGSSVTVQMTNDPDELDRLLAAAQQPRNPRPDAEPPHRQPDAPEPADPAQPDEENPDPEIIEEPDDPDEEEGDNPEEKPGVAVQNGTPDSGGS